MTKKLSNFELARRQILRWIETSGPVSDNMCDDMHEWTTDDFAARFNVNAADALTLHRVFLDHPSIKS